MFEWLPLIKTLLIVTNEPTATLPFIKGLLRYFSDGGSLFLRVASINQDTPSCDEQTKSNTAIHQGFAEIFL